MGIPAPSTLLRMTRPGFLSVTAGCVVLGWACASVQGVRIDPALAASTLILALAAHAGANVLNDSEDYRSGTDAANTMAIAPFSGGSRMILDGHVDDAWTRRVAWWLLAVAALGGAALAAFTSPLLWWIGVAGLVIAWAYSAPPLRLMSRGMGELGVALAWWLVTVGSDMVQRHEIAALPLWAGVGPALLIANILLINEFPDAASDASTGKRTLVVQAGQQVASWIYLLLALCAHIPLMVLAQQRGTTVALAGLALLPALAGWRGLMRHRSTPTRLRPAIVATLVAALLHTLLLALGLVLSR